MTDSASDAASAGAEPPRSTPARPDVLSAEALAAPPRQERSRRAREALLTAARSRFASNGYEATAIDDIAKDARVAVGGFYLHFRSKRQVLLVLFDRLLHEIEAEPWSKPGDDAATIMSRIRRRLGASFVHAGVHRAWSEVASHDPELAALQERVDAWSTAGLTAALNVAAASPFARRNVDIRTVAYMLSVVSWQLIDARNADREALSGTLVTSLRHVLFQDAGAESAESKETP
jgi:AcrR family transcriptional regulator